MRFFGVANAASLLALAGFSHAQFPSTPEGVTVRDSKFGDGVKLSWKEVYSLSCQRIRAKVLTVSERHL